MKGGALDPTTRRATPATGRPRCCQRSGRTRSSSPRCAAAVCVCVCGGGGWSDGFAPGLHRTGQRSTCPQPARPCIPPPGAQVRIERHHHEDGPDAGAASGSGGGGGGGGGDRSARGGGVGAVGLASAASGGLGGASTGGGGSGGSGSLNARLDSKSPGRGPGRLFPGRLSMDFWSERHGAGHGRRCGRARHLRALEPLSFIPNVFWSFFWSLILTVLIWFWSFFWSLILNVFGPYRALPLSLPANGRVGAPVPGPPVEGLLVGAARRRPWPQVRAGAPPQGPLSLWFLCSIVCWSFFWSLILNALIWFWSFFWSHFFYVFGPYLKGPLYEPACQWPGAAPVDGATCDA